MIHDGMTKIENLLREAFTPSYLQVEDDSAKHAGHAGARSGGGHYKVVLVSQHFSGKNLVEQHRMVNEVLRELFKNEIHALALTTYAPEQWRK
ncbi:MAG TPA: BolA family transcriptional regulator [Deltaproteobacteria bacterium]|nr:BolA family transcriptional regulator [Deltaproteobacteria bacterium]